MDSCLSLQMEKRKIGTKAKQSWLAGIDPTAARSSIYIYIYIDPTTKKYDLFSNTAPLAFKSLWIARDQADVWPIVCLHWGWVGMSNSPTNTRGMNYSIWIPVGKKLGVYLIIFESWVHLGSLTYHFVESSGGSLQQVRSFSDHVKENLWKSNGVLEITWKLSSSRARSPTPFDFPVFRWGGLFSFRDLEKKAGCCRAFFRG